ncbi:hypothetical protein RF11_06704 [Thelohanellus kitauei]|uniref:Uncharacterized protein n=1 Tax=Thelohanellus kitauei TaxID=669202 RepID=A0A0C2M8L7_THEKT|nr:hypothetical protein RF11_06704 [Thelohanellus kitauei]
MKRVEPGKKTDLTSHSPIPWTLKWNDRVTTLGGIVKTIYFIKVATNVSDLMIRGARNRYSRAIPRLSGTREGISAFYGYLRNLVAMNSENSNAQTSSNTVVENDVNVDERLA